MPLLSLSLRSDNSGLLFVPDTNMALGRRNFSLMGLAVWNGVPWDLRDPACTSEIFLKVAYKHSNNNKINKNNNNNDTNVSSLIGRDFYKNETFILYPSPMDNLYENFSYYSTKFECELENWQPKKNFSTKKIPATFKLTGSHVNNNCRRLKQLRIYLLVVEKSLGFSPLQRPGYSNDLVCNEVIVTCQVTFLRELKLHGAWVASLTIFHASLETPFMSSCSGLKKKAVCGSSIVVGMLKGYDPLYCCFSVKSTKLLLNYTMSLNLPFRIEKQANISIMQVQRCVNDKTTFKCVLDDYPIKSIKFGCTIVNKTTVISGGADTFYKAKNDEISFKIAGEYRCSCQIVVVSCLPNSLDNKTWEGVIEVANCGEKVEFETPKRQTKYLGPVLGFSLANICLISCVVGMVLYKKMKNRKRREHHKEATNVEPQVKTNNKSLIGVVLVVFRRGPAVRGGIFFDYAYCCASVFCVVTNLTISMNHYLILTFSMHGAWFIFSPP
ncbi:hypothetical protein HELRODRAFT_161948 [Helobdella robusta]|uniref:Uncharacterized protein n=1 Tax=Helobdella robusta TaxID=6412 RepID=T1ES25_HELRO|nr:hypothetical protein HELRODRAFT_161948 [Helobdella robusta]ESO02658.1 hypothetical protein HELRODRAFT_161948 [Helobdella robusta]